MELKDWEYVSKIHVEGISTGNANFETTLPSWNNWNLDRVPECSIVACNGDIIIGWASLSFISEREVYSGVAEDSLYVTEIYRGMGIGNVLLKKLIELSEKKGIWTLQAKIFPENTQSIALHKKHNFRIVGTHEKIGKMDGKWRNVTVMERRSKKVGI
ncbi:N-acetyltransferase family protein [Methanobacterium sp.]|uniref:GNAT family N-acetyltransferase n=1 Tax=Methanobacterium sp. TaxID=2164 RepID=UPI003C720E21